MARTSKVCWPGLRFRNSAGYSQSSQARSLVVSRRHSKTSSCIGADVVAADVGEAGVAAVADRQRSARPSTIQVSGAPGTVPIVADDAEALRGLDVAGREVAAAVDGADGGVDAPAAVELGACCRSRVWPTPSTPMPSPPLPSAMLRSMQVAHGRPAPVLDLRCPRRRSRWRCCCTTMLLKERAPIAMPVPSVPLALLASIRLSLDSLELDAALRCRAGRCRARGCRGRARATTPGPLASRTTL